MRNKSILPGLLFFLFPFSVRAHCPLCTIGAAAAAGGAAYLGVNTAVIGLFIGAFAVSTGWWVSRWVKKKYLPYQKTLIILASFLLTVIPILPLIGGTSPIYISWWGEYGKTIPYNTALLPSIFGGLVVSITPQLSKKISSLRNGKVFPFQGVILTLLSLILLGIIIQVVI